jgi:ATP-dependent Clp protease ATP-binding subunit ClpA
MPGVEAEVDVAGRLIRASFEAAQKLRNSWVGAEHLLIAIASDPVESAASSALATCGIDRATVTDYRFTVEPPVTPLEDGEQPHPNPHYYRLWGRAEGFAFAAGADRPLPEHLLLALLWDDDRLLSLLLEEVGRTPADLQVELAKLGVQVPRRPPPVG